MKIGKVARVSGLTERMLRHYEELGILTPAKTEKGTRYYDETDLLVAGLIRDLRSLDIPLETVAKIARERAMHDTGDASAAHVGALLSVLAEHLTEKAQMALTLRQIIVNAAEAVRQCRGCANVPGSETCPDCPMNEAATDNPVAALVWD